MKPHIAWADGFTLVEILVVIGLFGLLSTLILAGTQSLIDRHKPTAEETFWEALDTASEIAVSGDRTVLMSIEEQGTVLVVDPEVRTRRFPLRDDASIDLLRNDFQSLALVRGQLIDTGHIPCVRVYRDGTCEMFRAQLRMRDAEPKRISIDPWTCSHALSSSDQ